MDGNDISSFGHSATRAFSALLYTLTLAGSMLKSISCIPTKRLMKKYEDSAKDRKWSIKYNSTEFKSVPQSGLAYNSVILLKQFLFILK